MVFIVTNAENAGGNIEKQTFRESIDELSMDDLMKEFRKGQEANWKKQQIIYEIIEDFEQNKNMNKKEKNKIIKEISEALESNEDLSISAEHQMVLASHMKPGKDLKSWTAKLSLGIKMYAEMSKKMESDKLSMFQKFGLKMKLIKLLLAFVTGRKIKVSKKTRAAEIQERRLITLKGVEIQQSDKLNKGFLKVKGKSDGKDVIRYVSFDGSKVLDGKGKEIDKNEGNTLQAYLIIKKRSISRINNLLGVTDKVDKAKIAKKIVLNQQLEDKKSGGAQDVINLIISNWKNVAGKIKEKNMLEKFLETGKNGGVRNQMIDDLINNRSK